jgi:hypothetical protein
VRPAVGGAPRGSIMRKSQDRASMKAREGVERLNPKSVSRRALRQELAAAHVQTVAPAPAELTRKVSATVLAKVSLRTLKTACPTGLKGNIVRFILVPDFEAIHGSHGFGQLLPHLLDLRPALICIKATDVWRAKDDDDLKVALQKLPDNLSCWAVFDRFPEDDFQQMNGSRGFADPDDGRMKFGIIMVPELDEVDETTDESNKNLSVVGAYKVACVNVPWVSPVSHESMAGHAFQKAGYAQMLVKDGKKYLAAKPHDYRSSEIIVVDVVGGGEHPGNGWA